MKNIFLVLFSLSFGVIQCANQVGMGSGGKGRRKPGARLGRGKNIRNTRDKGAGSAARNRRQKRPINTGGANGKLTDSVVKAEKQNWPKANGEPECSFVEYLQEPLFEKLQDSSGYEWDKFAKEVDLSRGFVIRAHQIFEKFENKCAFAGYALTCDQVALYLEWLRQICDDLIGTKLEGVEKYGAWPPYEINFAFKKKHPNLECDFRGRTGM